jgi:hypothetical protein
MNASIRARGPQTTQKGGGGGGRAACTCGLFSPPRPYSTQIPVFLPWSREEGEAGLDCMYILVDPSPPPLPRSPGFFLVLVPSRLAHSPCCAAHRLGKAGQFIFPPPPPLRTQAGGLMANLGESAPLLVPSAALPPAAPPYTHTYALHFPSVPPQLAVAPQ